jgi:hypothetical protein
MTKRLSLSLASLALTALALPAHASFHLMQIEQVIGGVGGNTNIQAIQLRMRNGGQNLVAQGRIQAWDAAGANPVLLLDLTTNVAGNAAGSRVLIASPAFASTFGVTPDFIMTNLIPASYLAAGKITFERDAGTVLWAIAWGGASYTGTNTGETTNDSDGIFNPPVVGPLPSGSNQALRFTGAFGALSSNNLADYAVTAGSAVFFNNAGGSATVPVELMEFKIE